MTKKNIIISIFLVVIVFLICICVFTFNENRLKIIIKNNNNYVEEEINKALEIIKQKNNQQPIVIKKIVYDESLFSNTIQKWKEEYNDVIVVSIDYKVKTSKNAYDYGLKPGKTYKNWICVLVKNDNGKWIIKSEGLG